MSVKILDKKIKTYEPVTIEMTFDTLEQLKAFLVIYGNQCKVTEYLKSENLEVSSDAIGSTIDLETWRELKHIAATGCSTKGVNHAS